MASALRQKRREEEEITRVGAKKTKTRLAEIVPYKTRDQRKFEKVEAEAKAFDVHTAIPKKLVLAKEETGLSGLLSQVRDDLGSAFGNSRTVGAAGMLFALMDRARQMEKKGLGDAVG